jgi:hypothetical protein
MILTLRLNRDTASSSLLRHFYKPEETVLSAAPRELVGVALEHLHPIEKKYYWGEGFSRFPIHAYWPVNDEGLVARCFYLHPIMVNPLIRGVKPQITVDADYVDLSCPDLSDIYVCRDSDEIACFELTDPDAEDLNAATSSTEVSSAWDYARWAVVHANPLYTSHMHHWFFQIPIHIHATDFSSDWKKINLMSAAIAARVRWASVLLRKHYSFSRALDFVVSLRHNKRKLSKFHKKKYRQTGSDIQTQKKIDAEGLDIELYLYPSQLFSEKYSSLVQQWLSGSEEVRKEDIDRSYAESFVGANIRPDDVVRINLAGKFFGTSWGKVERRIRNGEGRWLGPDGRSKLFLSLLPSRDYLLETFIHTESGNYLRNFTVSVNGEPAFEQHIANLGGKIWHRCIFRTSGIIDSIRTEITFSLNEFRHNNKLALSHVVCKKIGMRTLMSK